MPIQLPAEILDPIKDHFRRRCAHAEEDWECGNDEEDSLTGALGSSFRKTRHILGRGSPWIWGVSWKKFRGRGKNTDEHRFGADGIFVLEATNSETEEVYTKGLLFQAMKIGNANRAALSLVRVVGNVLARQESANTIAPKNRSAWVPALAAEQHH